MKISKQVSDVVLGRDPRPSYRALIKQHGSAKAVLRHVMESGELFGTSMDVVQKLLARAYAEDQGWKVKD